MISVVIAWMHGKYNPDGLAFRKRLGGLWHWFLIVF